MRPAESPSARCRCTARSDIIVVRVGRLGNIRMRQIEHVAKLGEKQRVIGAFLPALLALPAGDERFCLLESGIWRWRGHSGYGRTQLTGLKRPVAGAKARLRAVPTFCWVGCGTMKS